MERITPRVLNERDQGVETNPETYRGDTEERKKLIQLAIAAEMLHRAGLEEVQAIPVDPSETEVQGSMTSVEQNLARIVLATV